MIELFAIQNPELMERLFSSFVLIVVFFMVRWLAIKAIRHWKTSSQELKRRWTVQVKNINVVILFLGLFIVWSSELRTFALSLVAFGAAVVLATKEMILCFMGGMYKASTRPFEVGDRIEINDHRGDVIDHDFLTTTLMEIGPGKDFHQYTGRQIVLPNSVFWSHPILNETSKSRYVLHVFKIPIKIFDDWRGAETVLLECAREVCAPFLNEAKYHLHRFGEREGIETPSVDPRVSIQFGEVDELYFMVRIPAPGPRTGRIEQEIIRRYLERMPSPVNLKSKDD